MTRRALTLALLIFAGTAEAQQPPAITQCTEPRPQMCTQIYSPVCGTTADGAKKTYASNCVACAEKTVISHTPDACT